MSQLPDSRARGVFSAIMLQEVRLRSAHDAHDAARIVAIRSGGREPRVPLLVSIDDPRDVAFVWTVRADDHPDDRTLRAVEPLAAGWDHPQRFTPRITERSSSLPSYYRLAVTGSGINDVAPQPIDIRSEVHGARGTASPLDLLWIATPAGSHAGLLVLTGTDEDEPANRPDPRDWPLPLSTSLGVRIYAGR